MRKRGKVKYRESRKAEKEKEEVIKGKQKEEGE
jgi:hypothetical protein